MVTMARAKGSEYAIDYGTIPLNEVANHERPLPDDYIAENGMDITKAFLKYAQPLVGELPEFVSLKGVKAKA